MTITLLWWYLPLALLLVSVLLMFVWPDEPSGHFMAGGPGVLKMLTVLLLIVGAVGICIGRALV